MGYAFKLFDFEYVMSQILSLPMVLIGIMFTFFAIVRKKNSITLEQGQPK